MIFRNGPVIHLSFTAEFLVETSEVMHRIQNALMSDSPIDGAGSEGRSALHFMRADTMDQFDGAELGAPARVSIDGVIHYYQSVPV